MPCTAFRTDPDNCHIFLRWELLLGTEGEAGDGEVMDEVPSLTLLALIHCNEWQCFLRTYGVCSILQFRNLAPSLETPSLFLGPLFCTKTVPRQHEPLQLPGLASCLGCGGGPPWGGVRSFCWSQLLHHGAEWHVDPQGDMLSIHGLITIPLCWHLLL
jgi:hypothetical protein